MPPARTEAGGVLLPLEPPPELAVGEAVEGVLLGLPIPPAPIPVLEGLPDKDEPEID